MPIDLPSTSSAGAHQTTSNDEVHLAINPVGEEVIIDQVTNTKPPPIKRRKRDVSSWKSQKRYISHQKGESYVSRRGVVVPAKEVKSLKDCLNDCKFKCGVSISENERQALFKAFYGMNQNGKHQYILGTTTKHQTERPKDRNGESYKKFTFRYFLNVGNQKVQVCKKFYLGTLSISQKPVYTVHNNKDEVTNTPKPDGRGKSAQSSRRLNEEIKETVRNHIKSFPNVESHYCRATTQRKYQFQFQTSI
uniref:Uncharacterized protein LOC114325349 n=1 Tax=Diabrotica virgifera virgifera TaxID=50390 RepID=A0A6P7F6Z3_DIAVI